MPDPQRYVVVDPLAMLVVGGAYLWDGEAEWTPPEIETNPTAGFLLILESDALDSGYSYPPPPPHPED
jgi:hypothetical protein